MKNMVFLAVTLSSLVCAAGTHLSIKSTSSQEPAAESDLDVRISPVKNVISPGETLRVRVEFWNDSANDIFLCKNYEPGELTYCHLNFIFEPASKASRSHLAGDVFDAGKEPFVNALVTNWVSIAPKHFYGSVVELDRSAHPELLNPGRYTLRAKYVSGGLLGTVYYNRLLEFPKEVAQLPGKSWQGEVRSNSISVRVVPNK